MEVTRWFEIAPTAACRALTPPAGLTLIAAPGRAVTLPAPLLEPLAAWPLPSVALRSPSSMTIFDEPSATQAGACPSAAAHDYQRV